MQYLHRDAELARIYQTGEHKLGILKKIQDSRSNEKIPATVLHNHKNAELITDQNI